MDRSISAAKKSVNEKETEFFLIKKKFFFLKSNRAFIFYTINMNKQQIIQKNQGTRELEKSYYRNLDTTPRNIEFN